MVRRSSEYALQIFFVPVTANREEGPTLWSLSCDLGKSPRASRRPC